MQLKFEGQTSSIDAGTLINVLMQYQSVAQEANLIYGGGTQEIKIQVNAIEKGSFIIDLEIVQNVIQQLFSKASVEYIVALTGIITFSYKAYKKLKGKPIKTEDDKKKISSLSVNGDMNVNINVYNSRATREAISKSIQAADDDASVEGFSVKDKEDNVIVTFSRDEFKEYKYDDFDTEEDVHEERIVDSEATLIIVGLNFEKGSRWQFMYDGFKIPIVVKDDALMRKIDEGERFGKGDSIRVKLRKIQKYNKEYRAYENKSYKIIEFYEHIIPPQQTELF
ncbi:hypothetical protein LK429_00310 [Hoylesella buccalis]|jgi:hypothetical protein|uniref:hypothetical protein n=1 Tax=Hoylesella buccalis TaxID=28127 RepID=UPI001D137253|nr:hypothetical protein [Hoylesella buccalis]UEA63068.1 hypothetical protein LK429_00310 [Hoylesella buccalis]UWP49642.1 hypothetical protein NQ518_00805 [Hoylesella buccalis ATCC 35310]